jgi:hypothetical protein
MPSRRAYLTGSVAALATVAGCTSPISSGDPEPEEESPTGTATTPTDGLPPTTDTPEAVVDYSHAPDDDLSPEDTAVVASTEWRRWLRTAAAGETARGATKPENCGRSPLRERSAVRLLDAGARSGRYRVAGETGGYFEYPLYAERADPPGDATVYALADLPTPVRDRFAEAIDTGGVGLPPQNRPFQFLQANARESEDAAYELWVRRDGTTYRLYSRFPTLTPPCGYYVVLRLEATGSARGPGLSLAPLGGGADSIAADAEAEGAQQLSEYPTEAGDALREYDYVMTATGFFRVQVGSRR